MRLIIAAGILAAAVLAHAATHIPTAADNNVPRLLLSSPFLSLQGTGKQHRQLQTSPSETADRTNASEQQLTSRAPVGGFDLFASLKLTEEELEDVPVRPVLNKAADDAGVSALDSQSHVFIGHSHASERSRLNVAQSADRSESAALDLELSLRQPGASVSLAYDEPSPLSVLHRPRVLPLHQPAPEAKQPQRVMQHATLSRVETPQGTFFSAFKPYSSGSGSARHVPARPVVTRTSDAVPRRARSTSNRRASTTVARRMSEQKLQDEVDSWVFLEAQRQYDNARRTLSRFRKSKRVLKGAALPAQSMDAVEDMAQVTKQNLREALKTPSEARDTYHRNEADRNKLYQARLKAGLLGKRVNPMVGTA